MQGFRDQRRRAHLYGGELIPRFAGCFGALEGKGRIIQFCSLGEVDGSSHHSLLSAEKIQPTAQNRGESALNSAGQSFFKPKETDALNRKYVPIPPLVHIQPSSPIYKRTGHSKTGSQLAIVTKSVLAVPAAEGTVGVAIPNPLLHPGSIPHIQLGQIGQRIPCGTVAPINPLQAKIAALLFRGTQCTEKR